jgi:hypothetical protein
VHQRRRSFFDIENEGHKVGHSLIAMSDTENEDVVVDVVAVLESLAEHVEEEDESQSDSTSESKRERRSSIGIHTVKSSSAAFKLPPLQRLRWYATLTLPQTPNPELLFAFI